MNTILTQEYRPKNKKVIDTFERAVKVEGIEIDNSEKTIKQLETATFSTKNKVSGIVYPASTVHIRFLLGLAQNTKTNLYPISGGKNWGYGSCVPPHKKVVVLSLSKMNQIVDFDEEHGIITLEPGVSFKQLQTFLTEKRSKWHFNSPGSTTEASVLGNTLSRGCLLYTSPSPRDKRQSRMPSSA